MMKLQVLLGRERGRVYPLVSEGSLIAGRGSDAHIVLASDLVSRQHALLDVRATEIRVEDLGSSNGTYVNGCRVVGEGRAGPRDVLLFGDVALRIHEAIVPALAPTRPEFHAPGTSINLSGNLLEIPPATLLRYLAVVKKTGRLALTSPPLRSEITFTRGHIGEIIVDTKKTRDPIQALTSILRWRGAFDVLPSTSASSSLLLGLDAVLPSVGSAARPSHLPKPPR
jgi:hypothetical protein